MTIKILFQKCCAWNFMVLGMLFIGCQSNDDSSVIPSEIQYEQDSIIIYDFRGNPPARIDKIYLFSVDSQIRETLEFVGVPANHKIADTVVDPSILYKRNKFNYLNNQLLNYEITYRRSTSINRFDLIYSGSLLESFELNVSDTSENIYADFKYTNNRGLSYLELSFDIPVMRKYFYYDSSNLLDSISIELRGLTIDSFVRKSTHQVLQSEPMISELIFFNDLILPTLNNSLFSIPLEQSALMELPFLHFSTSEYIDRFKIFDHDLKMEYEYELRLTKSDDSIIIEEYLTGEPLYPAEGLLTRRYIIYR